MFSATKELFGMGFQGDEERKKAKIKPQVQSHQREFNSMKMFVRTYGSVEILCEV